MMKNEFKWTEEQVEALEASIEHWENLVLSNNFGEVVSISSYSCACCVKFNNDDSKCACKGCPIEEVTGEIFCGNTPYSEAARMKNKFQPSHSNFVKAAQVELDFLHVVLEAGR